MEQPQRSWTLDNMKEAPDQFLNAHSEEFDRLVRAGLNRGYISYRFREDQKLDRLFRAVLFVYSSLAQNTRLVRISDQSPVHLHVGVVEGSTVNAFAAGHRQVRLIAFHRGLFWSLFDDYRKIVTVLDEGIDASQTPLRVLSKGIAFRRHAIKDPAPENERNSLRFEAAFMMLRIACEFIFYHEFQHVLMGHVPFAKWDDGVCMLREAEEPETQRCLVEPDEQHAMEFSADFHAARLVAGSMSGDGFAGLYEIDGSDPQVLRSLAHLTSMAIMTVMSRFGATSRGVAMPGHHHPSAQSRYVNVIQTITKELDATASIHADVWAVIESTARGALLRACNEVPHLLKTLPIAKDSSAIDQAMGENDRLRNRVFKLVGQWNSEALDQAAGSNKSPGDSSGRRKIALSPRYLESQ